MSIPPFFTGTDVTRLQFVTALHREMVKLLPSVTSRAEAPRVAQTATEMVIMSLGMRWGIDVWNAQDETRAQWIAYIAAMARAGVDEHLRGSRPNREPPQRGEETPVEAPVNPSPPPPPVNPNEVIDEPDEPPPTADGGAGPYPGGHTMRKPLMMAPEDPVDHDPDANSFWEDMEDLMERFYRPPVQTFGDVGNQLKAQEEATKSELAKYLATAGQDTLAEQESEQSDRLKMHNLLMGQTPLHPLGQMDNPFWRSNLAHQGLRYQDELYPMPPVFMGGTMTSGAQPFGSYPSYPDRESIVEQLYPIKYH